MLVRVVVFYFLTFVFTIVLGAAQQAANVSAQTVILPQWGPGLAALLMLLIFRKDRFRITVFGDKVPATRYALAVLIPAGGAALVYLVYRLVFGASAVGSSAATPWSLLLWFPLGAFGEELGWRGYLHKRLNPAMAALSSSVVVGALWALWHVGMYGNGALTMAFFVLLMISYSIVIYALVADTGFNVLLAAVFHMAINVANLFTYALVTQVEFMAISSLVWAAIAIVVVLSRRTQFLTGQRAQ